MPNQRHSSTGDAAEALSVVPSSRSVFTIISPEKYLPKKLPYGKILGKVKLVDCIKMSPEFKELLLKENSDIYTKSSFQENYGWQVSDVEVFENPIDVKGHLSLWEYNM